MNAPTPDLVQSARKGDLVAFARLLTRLERVGPRSFRDIPELLHPEKLAFRIGITGPPGAGKSTLIGRLITQLRARGKKVGVLAVDPSSPFTKGAILGDRIRYHEHFGDPGVFIRSLGSRGSLGGLSASAYLMVRAFDLAGFDVVILETVGVGQTELDIMNVADLVSVVLVPESGDSIQGMKAGLLEIAQLFVVNKADRPGAEIFARELEAALRLTMDASVDHELKVLRTSATTGTGIDELTNLYLAALTDPDQNQSWQTRRASIERLQSEAIALLRAASEKEIRRRALDVKTTADFTGLFDK